MNYPTQSECIDKIAKPFSLLQSEIIAVKKDSKSMHHNYASLPACLMVIKPILLKYNFSAPQLLTFDEDKKCILKTSIIHESGQWFASYFPLEYLFNLVISKTQNLNVPQGFGSLLTYGKRYSLNAMCGLDDVDDDADSLSQFKQNVQKSDPAANYKKQIIQRCAANGLDVVKFAEFHKFSSENKESMKDILDNWEDKKTEFLESLENAKHN